MGVKRYLLDLLSPKITFLALYEENLIPKLAIWAKNGDLECFLKILVKAKLSDLKNNLHIVRYSLDGATI